MNIIDFEELTDMQQMRLVSHKGIFISTTEDKEFKYIVYKVTGFFVEIRFEKTMLSSVKIKVYPNVYECTSMILHSN